MRERTGHGMRVALDTNVYLRAFLSSQSPVAAILAAWENEQLDLVTSTAQLAEIDGVFNRPAIRRLLRAEADPEQLIRSLWEGAHAVSLSQPYPRFDRDPGDAHLLALLRDGRLDVLVTEDKDLLSLREYAGARILTIKQFLSVLAE